MKREDLLVSAAAVPQEEPAPAEAMPDDVPGARGGGAINRAQRRAGGSEPAKSPVTIEPWAFRVNEASRVSGLGRTKLYELAKEGRLKMIKVAGRTLIPAESLRALLQQAA